MSPASGSWRLEAGGLSKVVRCLLQGDEGAELCAIAKGQGKLRNSVSQSRTLWPQTNSWDLHSWAHEAGRGMESEDSGCESYWLAVLLGSLVSLSVPWKVV